MKSKLESLYQTAIKTIIPPYLVKIDFIKTATVPIIKMKFNPKYNMAIIIDSDDEIEVDITLEDASYPYHQGVNCSEYVSNVINHHHIIKPVIIVLK